MLLNSFFDDTQSSHSKRIAASLVFEYSLQSGRPSSHSISQKNVKVWQDLAPDYNELNFKLIAGNWQSINTFWLPELGVTGFYFGRLFTAASADSMVAVEQLVNILRKPRANWLQLSEFIKGLFVVVLVDLRDHYKLYLINDHLGIMPFYITEHDGALFGSSSALALRTYMSQKVSANMAAVSQFLTFGYSAMGAPIMADVDQLAPASVTQYINAKIEVTPYMHIPEMQPGMGCSAMASRIHELVNKNFTAWVAHIPQMALGLSGGYDSRYLSVLSKNLPSVQTQYMNIAFTPNEECYAQKVASLLNIPLDVIAVPGSIWDEYDKDGPYIIRPDGFSITKGLDWILSRYTNSRYIVSGFFGDPIVRGTSFKRINISDPKKTTIDHCLQGLFDNRSLLPWFRESVAKALISHSYSTVKESFSCFTRNENLPKFLDIFLRQRCYIANNFTENFPWFEAVLPFYDPELTQLAFTYPQSDFTITTYQNIFMLCAPDLAILKHCTDSNNLLVKKSKAASFYRKKVWACLFSALTQSLGHIFDRKFILTRLPFALVSDRSEYVVHHMLQLMQLLDTCQRYNIEIDWDGYKG